MASFDSWTFSGQDDTGRPPAFVEKTTGNAFLLNLPGQSKVEPIPIVDAGLRSPAAGPPPGQLPMPA